MSVTVDTNVLIYASNRADSRHRPAGALVERLAQGPGIVYLFWPVLLGYLRIATHPGILPRPLSAGDVLTNISALLALPHVRTAGEDASFWETFRSTAPSQIRGNDVPDAHLVALMRQQDVRTIYTRDRAFRRFDGIEVRDITA